MKGPVDLFIKSHWNDNQLKSHSSVFAFQYRWIRKDEDRRKTLYLRRRRRAVEYTKPVRIDVRTADSCEA